MNRRKYKKMSNTQLVALILKVIFAGIIFYNALFTFCKFLLIFWFFFKKVLTKTIEYVILYLKKRDRTYLKKIKVKSVMLKRIANTKDAAGYVEQLFKTNKRYYRIIRTRNGEMYSIYVNESEYGEPKYDIPMDFNKRTVREYTIAECKESIKIYDMLK